MNVRMDQGIRIGASGGVSSAAVASAIASPNSDVVMRSTTNRKADTKRTRWISYQKQEVENQFNGGEVQWFDASPTAKAMLTWRFPINPTTRRVLPVQAGAYDESAWQRTVWVGAHYFAQDQADDNNPTDIHAHWSVETPDPNLQLRTRFQIFFNDRDDPSLIGSNNALISTNRADFLIQRGTTDGVSWGRNIYSGSNGLETMWEITRADDKAASLRWKFGATADLEAANDAGWNFALRRYSNTGTLLGTVFQVRRETGEMTFGAGDNTPPSDPSQIMVRHAGAERNGIFVYPSAALTTGAAFKARFTTATESFLQSKLNTEGNSRFSVQADGRMSWGAGTGAVDTSLYRPAGVASRLKTDGDFAIGGQIRLGGGATSTPAATGGQGALIAIQNLTTPPTNGFGTNASGGGYIYFQNGAAYVMGGNGTITKFGDA